MKALWALLAFFGSGIASLVGYLAAAASRKLIVVGISISTLILITAAMIACLKALILGLILGLSVPAWLINGIAMFIPYDFFTVLAAVLSAKSCRFAFEIASKKLLMMNSGT